jgi:2-methylcitrate dehydratase PrpD
MQLDASRTATALGLAASLASGIKANFGTMTKPLHVGHCARNGLFAALLAREGFTANDGAFEHKQGFLEVFNGAGTYDTARMLDGWGAPFDIVKPGIAIKQYPCCGSTHPALDAILDIARAHAVDPASVVRIDGWIHPRRLEHTNRPNPQTPLDAKFSLQYCLARALSRRTIAIDDFEADALDDPVVRRLMPLIHVAGYGTDRFPAENHFGAEVHVTMADGTVLARKAEQPLGRTSAVPLPIERLREKFTNCAARVLPKDRVPEIVAAIEGLDGLADMRTLTALLAAPPPE